MSPATVNGDSRSGLWRSNKIVEDTAFALGANGCGGFSLIRIGGITFAGQILLLFGHPIPAQLSHFFCSHGCIWIIREFTLNCGGELLDRFTELFRIFIAVEMTC